jgi:predicted transcriptional regulator
MESVTVGRKVYRSKSEAVRESILIMAHAKRNKVSMDDLAKKFGVSNACVSQCYSQLLAKGVIPEFYENLRGRKRGGATSRIKYLKGE